MPAVLVVMPETAVVRPGTLNEHSARMLVESIKEYAIYLLDLEGRVVSWNPGAQAIKGYAADEVLGKHFSIFFTPEDRAASEPERELLAAVDGRTTIEAWRVRKDGSRFWASIVMTALHDDAGKLVGFAKITRDLTDRYERERQSVRLARIEEALRVRNEFFTEAKSGLEAILTSMRVHLRSLASTIDTMAGEGMQTKLRMLEWGVDRMMSSVDRVIDLARATGDKLAQELASPLSGADPTAARPDRRMHR